MQALRNAHVVLPPWLNGTPCVVNTRLNRPFKGSDCIAHLRSRGGHGHDLAPIDDLTGIEADQPNASALDYTHEKPAPGQPDVPRGMSGARGRESKVDESAIQRLIQERAASSSTRA